MFKLQKNKLHKI